jgi:hypothetical protein
MVAYKAETCCWINTGINSSCVWLGILLFVLSITQRGWIGLRWQMFRSFCNILLHRRFPKLKIMNGTGLFRMCLAGRSLIACFQPQRHGRGILTDKTTVIKLGRQLETVYGNRRLINMLTTNCCWYSSTLIQSRSLLRVHFNIILLPTVAASSFSFQVFRPKCVYEFIICYWG